MIRRNGRRLTPARDAAFRVGMEKGPIQNASMLRKKRPAVKA
jgi:hypothetical protein